MRSVLAKTSQSIEEIWERFSIFDILHLTIFKKNDNGVRELENILCNFIQEISSNQVLKPRMTAQVLRILGFVPDKMDSFVDRFMQGEHLRRYLDDPVMSACLARLISGVKFPISANHSEKVRANSVWKRLFNFICYFASMSNANDVIRLVESLNWRMFVACVVIFEVSANLDHSGLILKCEKYSREIFAMCQIQLDTLVFFVMRACVASGAESRLAALTAVQKSLWPAIQQIEEVCSSWRNLQTKSQKNGPFRVGFLQSFYAFVVFVKYFVDFDSKGLPVVVPDKLGENKRSEFVSTLGFDRQQRKVLYRKLMNNKVFCFRKEAMVFPEFVNLGFIELQCRANSGPNLLWKCLIELDDVARDVCLQFVEHFVRDIPERGELFHSVKFANFALRFVNEVFVHEMLFEEFVISLRFMVRFVNKALFAKQKKLMFEGTPGVVNRFYLARWLMGPLHLVDMMNCFILPYFHTNIAGVTNYGHDYLDAKFKFDSRTQTFRFPNKPAADKRFMVNLLYSWHILEHKLLMLWPKPGIELEAFIWQNSRSKINARILFTSNLFERFIECIRRIDKRESTENIYKFEGYLLKQRILRVQMAVMYRQFALHELVNEEWLKSLVKLNAHVSPATRRFIHVILNVEPISTAISDQNQMIVLRNESKSLSEKGDNTFEDLGSEIEDEKKCKHCKKTIKSAEKEIQRCSLYTFDVENFKHKNKNEDEKENDDIPDTQREMMVMHSDFYHHICYMQHGRSNYNFSLRKAR